MFQSSATACPAAFRVFVCAAGAWSVALAATTAIAGDCVPHWDPTIGQPGMGLTTLPEQQFEHASVRALTVHNGDLIAGGVFDSAGGQQALGIARWDGFTWHPIDWGDLPNQLGFVGHGELVALTVYNGDLIAAGSVSVDETGEGLYLKHNSIVARWDGSDWHALKWDSQPSHVGAVGALTVYNGDLIAAGMFTNADGQTVNNIARWDGTAWHPLASGGEIGVSGTVAALTVYNGNLIAGGWFTTAGGQEVNRIARWDGSAWHPFESGGQIGVDASVTAMLAHDDDLIVGGAFHTAGGQQVNRIARWDGGSGGGGWHPFESGGQIGLGCCAVYALAADDAGDLIVAGWLETAGGEEINYIARWNGSGWHPFVSPGGQIGVKSGQIGVEGSVMAMTLFNGDLIVGGSFTQVGGESDWETANRIATWHGCK